MLCRARVSTAGPSKETFQHHYQQWWRNLQKISKDVQDLPQAMQHLAKDYAQLLEEMTNPENSMHPLTMEVVIERLEAILGQFPQVEE